MVGRAMLIVCAAGLAGCGGSGTLASPVHRTPANRGKAAPTAAFEIQTMLLTGCPQPDAGHACQRIANVEMRIAVAEAIGLHLHGCPGGEMLRAFVSFLPAEVATSPAERAEARERGWDVPKSGQEARRSTLCVAREGLIATRRV